MKLNSFDSKISYIVKHRLGMLGFHNKEMRGNTTIFSYKETGLTLATYKKEILPKLKFVDHLE
ncbi:hypothetical protein ACFX5K_06110 [Rickettsiales bacterium LUAb2]